MKKCLCSLLLLMCSFFIASSASALLNGGFEAGDLGWTKAGNVFFSPFAVGSPAPPASVMPTEGSRFVQMNNGFPGGSDTGCCESASSIEATLGIDLSGTGATEGSYIYQDFSVTAGSTITFDWNFLTDEETEDSSYNDFALASLTSLSDDTFWILADTFSSLVSSTIGGYDLMTGNQSFSAIAPFSGTARLGFAVLDVGDVEVQSSLYMDNVQVSAVPEPATIFLIGFGFVGLATVGRKKVFKK